MRPEISVKDFPAGMLVEPTLKHPALDFPLRENRAVLRSAQILRVLAVVIYFDLLQVNGPFRSSCRSGVAGSAGDNNNY
jgi:hypothetical protein